MCVLVVLVFMIACHMYVMDALSWHRVPASVTVIVFYYSYVRACACAYCVLRPQRALMLTDGCLRSSNASGCRGVARGLFNSGLHSGVQYFVANARGVLATDVDNTTAMV